MSDEINNEFDDLSMDDEMPPSNMDDAPAENPPLSSGDEEITPSSILVKKFIKNPEVGSSIEFTIKKVVKNNNTKGKNKATGEEFTIGLKKADNTVIRHDVITMDESRYTISTWEIFYKLFGPTGVLSKYGQEKNTFEGAKIKITKNYDGSHANMKSADVMKIKGFGTLEETETYKKEVATAMKEKRLYTLVMLD